ncbi:MgtC/SapB family protein [Rhodocaloribacter sp.]
MENVVWTPPLRLLVALLLGILIGLERESSKKEFEEYAGVRTFTLLSLFGFGCAWLFQLQVTLALPLGLLAVGALTVLEYLTKRQGGHRGWTSEVAALLTYVIGALALLADVWVPMALGVIATLLLAEKAQIETYVERLEKTEFLAVVKFLLVTVIILPALPDRGYTRFALNPAHIWQIVVLVSSIGFVGYFLSKRFGKRVGLWLSGLLGGIVSSTAVTVAVGRLAQRSPEQRGSALQATLLASAVMYLRILVLVWILNPAFMPDLWWRLVLLFIVGVALAVPVHPTHAVPSEPPTSTLQNPFEIRPAVVFASLFVVLSVATTLVKNAFGDAGLLTLSALVGVTDIDPFILSLIRGSAAVSRLIVTAILLAMMSNTIVKGVYFSMLVKPVRKATLWRFGLWAALHIPLALIP